MADKTIQISIEEAKEIILLVESSMAYYEDFKSVEYWCIFCNAGHIFHNKIDHTKDCKGVKILKTLKDQL